MQLVLVFGSQCRVMIMMSIECYQSMEGVKDSMASYALIGRHSEAKIQL